MKLLSNPKIIKTAPIGLELCSIIQRYDVLSKASTKHAFDGSLTHATNTLPMENAFLQIEHCMLTLIRCKF